MLRVCNDGWLIETCDLRIGDDGAAVVVGLGGEVAGAGHVIAEQRDAGDRAAAIAHRQGAGVRAGRGLRSEVVPEPR